MSRKKILFVLGTRPETIKLAPIILELKRRPGTFDPVVCSTAQHREMLDTALEPFGIVPDHDLNIMTRGQTLAQVTARAISGLDQVIAQERPDCVLVQGDTTSAFCGALAAYYHQISVGHVEAGLRTGNKYAPYPEEMNRCMITPLADIHFAPTERARQALRNEGIDDSKIHVTGNSVIDALLLIRDRVRQEKMTFPDGLESFLDGGPVVLVTGHRRESFGAGFENICHAIRQVADRYPAVRFVYPVHLNPNVQEKVYGILGNHQRIRLLDPLSYQPFVWLMDRSTIVLTDSGGVQEEAPSLGKPVLVMRETTEREEGIEAGNAILVGVDRHKISAELCRLIEDPKARLAMTRVQNPYGDGKTAARIADVLARGW